MNRMTSGTYILSADMMRKWSTKEKIGSIISGYDADRNSLPIKLALEDLLERIETLEVDTSNQSKMGEE